jgi:GT2 family glycosyltransferase
VTQGAASKPVDPLPVTVVIACHDERRWLSLLESIDSAQSQVPQAAEVTVVVDHCPTLFNRLRRHDSLLTVVENRHERGASGARNSGAERATTPYIAFLDDDAVAHPGWLANLIGPMSRESVVGTGGLVRPAWSAHRPLWFPDEFAWVVGASHTGLPTVAAPVRNVWAENMAVKREAFEQVGGFRVGFGKVGERSRPEDTDLCIRMTSVRPGACFMYVPSAIVDHKVPADRMTYQFFLRRCYSEGRGKVELSGHLGEDQDLGMENEWLRRTVPRGIWNSLTRPSPHERRREGVQRSAAMLSGVGAAAVGGAASYGAVLFAKMKGAGEKVTPRPA